MYIILDVLSNPESNAYSSVLGIGGTLSEDGPTKVSLSMTARDSFAASLFRFFQASDGIRIGLRGGIDRDVSFF
mgnify:CR=1 FL=1